MRAIFNLCYLGFSKYESFRLCRIKNFRNRAGEKLLHEVSYALPPDVDFGKEVKEIFLLLAKVRIIKKFKSCTSSYPIFLDLVSIGF